MLAQIFNQQLICTCNVFSTGIFFSLAISPSSTEQKVFKSPSRSRSSANFDTLQDVVWLNVNIIIWKWEEITYINKKKQSVVTASFLKVKILDHFTATYSELLDLEGDLKTFWSCNVSKFA
jgi:hypothetical protein